MTAHSMDLTKAATFVETTPDTFTVTIDTHYSFTVVRDGSRFIAVLPGRGLVPCWSFGQAVRACAEFVADRVDADDEPDDFTAFERAASAADRAYQFKREQIA